MWAGLFTFALSWMEMDNAGIQSVIYHVAGHAFEVCARFPGRVRAALPSYEPFLGMGWAEGPLLFRLSFCPALAVRGKEAWRFAWGGLSCAVRRDGQTHCICICPPGMGEPYVMHADERFAEVSVCMRGTPYDALVLDNFLMLAFAFSALRRETLLLHASAVLWQGRAYLFLGKSGTGKSTHARLWLQCVEGSELLNDDNPAVRLVDGRAVAYGTPWSGKAPCYRNLSAAAGAFVRLEQAHANEISRREAVRGFAELLPSCFNMRWDSGMYALLCDVVSKVAATVPVFHLKCLPDKAAALLSHKTVAR